MSSSDGDFARVYNEHLWHVFGFIAYRVRGRELAEDLTQTTFERALRAWPRFDPGRASEQTWLLSIARNLVTDHHRRDYAEPSGEIDERLLPLTEGPDETHGQWPELHDALLQLGERDREVIALRFGADLSGPDIAEVTGLSLANVQQILSRSLRRLRSLLETADEARP